MVTAPWSYSARCDVVSMGVSEDGDVLQGRSWYVIAEHSLTGARYRHDHCDVSLRHTEHVCPPGAARLLERVRRAAPDPVDRHHWYGIAPAYGSRAYLAEQAYTVERERQDAEQGR